MCFKFGFNLIIVLKLTFKLSKQQQLVAKSLIVLLCVHDLAINENVTPVSIVQIYSLNLPFVVS